jgi:hypothetical protein
VDPHHFDADPDLTYHPDADRDSVIYADPVPNFYLMRMRIQIRIRLFTLMRIWILIQIRSFQIKAQTLEKVLK